MLWQSCDNVVTMLWQCCDPRYLASVRSEDGWILAKFFFCPGNKNANKKTENNVQPSWPNKDLSYGQKRTFAEFRFEKNTCYVVKMLWRRCDNVVTMLRQCCDPRYLASVKSEEEVVWAHRARSGSQSEWRLCFILPACGFSEARGFKLRPNLQPRSLRSLWQRS